MARVNNNELEKDREWIQRSKEDPSAFQYLFDKYYNMIFNHALRRTCDSFLAKDITANTFLKALENIKKYECRGLPFSSWLYRIATNEINLNYRKIRRLVPLSEERIRQLRGDNKTDEALIQAEEKISQNKTFKKLHGAITALKLKYQNVLTLRYFENKSIKEISLILNLSENTVKTHIRRGLQQLKKRL